MTSSASRKRAFRPRLLPSLVTFALLPLLVGLGFWQLERAAEKRALLTSFLEGGTVALDLAEALDGGLGEIEPYRAVSVRGRYEVGRQILLDAMIDDGEVGFQVLTPLLIDGREERVLVNRGWVAAGATRDALPDLPLDPGLREISGRLAGFRQAGLSLNAAGDAGDGWPRVMLYPDQQAVSAALGAPVLERVILLDPAQPDGFRRQWQPPGFGPQRHIAYAVQWFALALALLVIYVVVNLRRAHD